jgi:hypothetical protein
VISEKSTTRFARGAEFAEGSEPEPIDHWQRFSPLTLSCGDYPRFLVNDFGFRVASLSSDAAIPEPSMMVIGTVFGLGGLMAKRRMKK